MNYQSQIPQSNEYQSHIAEVKQLIEGKHGTWDGINPESVARMRLQNRFQTGLDIARYTAAIMRKDMAAYDADPANYTQSLGCWHGFIAQQTDDLDQEALRHDRPALHLPVRLDGRRAALRVRPPARPVDAREDLRAGADRGDLHLPAPGRRPRARRPVPRARRRPQGWRQRQGKDAAGGGRQLIRPMSCRSSPTSTRASATPKRPICSPRR